MIIDKDFEKLIAKAIDSLPRRDAENLNNVVITYADEPSGHQKEKLSLRKESLLLGLYEGIPLTQRGSNYSLVLPDKITLFKQPIVEYCHMTNSELYEQIRKTLWHEIAHFYGLDHDEIRKRES